MSTAALYPLAPGSFALRFIARRRARPTVEAVKVLGLAGDLVTVTNGHRAALMGPVLPYIFNVKRGELIALDALENLSADCGPSGESAAICNVAGAQSA